MSSTPDQSDRTLEERVEDAALESHDADPQSRDGAGKDGGSTDGGSTGRGDSGTTADAATEGDVTEPLGGSTSGEEDYVAVNPAGISGDRTAGLVEEDEDGRGESHAEPGAQVHGSSGR